MQEFERASLHKDFVNEENNTDLISLNLLKEVLELRLEIPFAVHY